MKLNLLALALGTALIACGGATTTPQPTSGDTGGDASTTHDLASAPPDLAPGSINVHLDSGAFSDADIQCSAPSDCAGAVCCVTVNSGAFGSTTCQAAASCVPNISTSTLTGETRVCATDADCAGSTELPTCCTATLSGQTGKICFNALYASFASLAGATITCP